MSVIWSGITEEGAVVPVQVEASGKVVAQGYPGEKGEKGDPGEEGPEGPPGEYSEGDDVVLNNAYFTGGVGIGTQTPYNNLVVLGTGNATTTTVTPAEFTSTIQTDNAYINLGSVNSLAAIQGSGSGTSYKLLLNPFQGDVGIGTNNPQAKLDVEGDVILKSRNKKWMIVEQSGLAHLVEQGVFLRLNPHLAASDADADADADYDPKTDTGPVLEPVETVYPALRDIPGELSLVEQALSEVFEKLRMSPPAGWPVWDGQSEVTTDNDNA